MNNEEKNAEHAQTETSAQTQTETEASAARNGSMSVFIYIIILFSAALLLMCLSSLIHQRNNTEALGKLQSSVSVMQEVQNLQERIIGLQDAQKELEERLEETESQRAEALAQADAEGQRAEALQRLYVLEAQYQTGRYQACQAGIDAFEADGLAKHLPSESPADGVISPLSRYRQIQEATPARIAEAAQPSDETETP